MVTDDKFSPVMSLLIVVVMQYHKVISPSISTTCTESVTYPITIYQNLAMGLD